jgi:hypothetical protein
MTEKEILTLWSEIITQYGLQTTIDLISNSPKILSPWIEGPTSKDGRQRFWYRKLLFSNSPFPEVVRICEYFVSSRFEVVYFDKLIPPEKQYESDLKIIQEKADKKLQTAEYYLSD